MFKPEAAFEYIASATRSNIKTSNSIGVIILLGIVIIWISQIFPNLSSINTFVQFNSYLLRKQENTMHELKTLNLTNPQKQKKKTEIDNLTDTAALKLEGLKLDFELPGFPKLQQVGLQTSIVLWLTMYFLIFRFFYQSRKTFYLNNLKALGLFKKHLAGKVEPYTDFDIHFPFWVMPIPKVARQTGPGIHVTDSEFKTLFNVDNIVIKTGLLVLTLIIGTAFFLYNVAISLKLYYSQINYLNLKENIPPHVYIFLYGYVFCCFLLTFFWLQYVANWFNHSIAKPKTL